MNVESSDRIIALPAPSLVFLLGARGSGKTTFARRFFDASAIVSLDACRQMVGDDGDTEQPSATAISLFHTIIDNRLEAGKLVVVDADNTSTEARRPLVSLARKNHLFAVAIAFDIGDSVCIERNASRSDVIVPPYVVKRQSEAIRSAIKTLVREGIREVHVLSSPRDVDAAVIVKTLLWTDRRDEHGPFDIIGDVHGCADELEALLEVLGYRVMWDEVLSLGVRVTPPPGRRAIFLGDIIDRGPRIVDSLRIAMSMVQSGAALCVPGNHEVKLAKKLRGRPVSTTHGLAETLAELDRTTPAFRDEVALFIEGLVGHYLLDEGRLCVVHAGIKERMQGRSSSAAREFGLYGETTGETDDYGLPVRQDWATEYQGRACIVYGHTPALTAEWVNNTICIDTGCVFGGALTALRYPERELVSVPAARRYFEPKKPLTSRVSKVGQEINPAKLDHLDFDSDSSQKNELLDFDSFQHGAILKTRFHHDVAVREENAPAALEMLSRHAVDPRWLVHLPPVIAPVPPSTVPGMLEHPQQAFAYYREKEVARVVCQEKHRGQRVVIIACEDTQTAKIVFGAQDDRSGIVYTRTGRPYFADRAAEDALIEQVRHAARSAGFFADYGPFVVLEAELLPGLTLRRPLIDVAGIDSALQALDRAANRGIGIEQVRARLQERKARLGRYVEALDRANEPANRARIVLVQILATKGQSWASRNHFEQAAAVERITRADEELFIPTTSREVVLGDAISEEAAISFWSGLSEGIVVKPVELVQMERQGLMLPALLCRTPEALRFVYGPEYDLAENLAWIARRSPSALRAIALGQFALGMEALARFSAQEPLPRVHACIFAALALECENLNSRPS